MRSKFLRLNLRDFFKGMLVAVITAILTFAINELESGTTIDIQLLKKIGVSGIIAFLSYILKNLITNSNGEILTDETKIPEK